MNDKYYKVINVQHTNGHDALKFSNINQALATASVFHNTESFRNDYRVIEYDSNTIKVIGDNGNIN